MEKPGGLQSTGSQRVGHDWATSLSPISSGLLLILWESNHYFLRFLLCPHCEASPLESPALTLDITGRQLCVRPSNITLINFTTPCEIHNYSLGRIALSDVCNIHQSGEFGHWRHWQGQSEGAGEEGLLLFLLCWLWLPLPPANSRDLADKCEDWGSAAEPGSSSLCFSWPARESYPHVRFHTVPCSHLPFQTAKPPPSPKEPQTKAAWSGDILIG